ncbi:hypothetical protein HDG37_000961 [Paraburkholderia sp. MM5384-R2]|nr:hypothetical protein [Paraburkholderia sp. MM5384-R2]
MSEIDKEKVVAVLRRPSDDDTASSRHGAGLSSTENASC